MKNLLFRFLLVLTIALATSLGRAQDQSSEPAADNALPANIPPDSPLAQIYKLLQAGVGVDVIKNYIATAPGEFDLDAEKIIALNDAGAPSELINAMMQHDKNFASSTAAPMSPPAPDNTASVATAPPTAPVTVQYFNETLSPYGSWVDVEGYGRCWRPTAVIYDSNWQPYCDRGHWAYTDCGWYWQSDYSWGVAFHYGRWFRDTHLGWCWYPDTTWGPSWVSWRSGGDYCGWAPLPPFTEYRPGGGFFYRGASVSIGFDFGLSSSCYTFVSVNHFCDRRPRNYAVDRQHVTQIYTQTTVINNYGDHNRTIVNNGISVDRVRSATHRALPAVAIAKLPDARREGWRGNASRAPEHDPAENRNAAPNERNQKAGANHDSSPSSPTQFESRRAMQNQAATPTPNSNGRNANDSTPGMTVHNQRHITPPVSSGNNSAPIQSQNFRQQNRETVVTPPANSPQHYTPQIEQRSSVTPAVSSQQPRLEQRQERQTSSGNVQRTFTMPSENSSSHGAPQMEQHNAPAQTERFQQREQRQVQAAPPAASSSQSQSSDHSDRNSNRDKDR